MDPVLPDSDVVLDGILELAVSGESMAGSGETWSLFADGRDELRALRSGRQDMPYGRCGKDVSVRLCVSLHTTRGLTDRSGPGRIGVLAGSLTRSGWSGHDHAYVRFPVREQASALPVLL